MIFRTSKFCILGAVLTTIFAFSIQANATVSCKGVVESGPKHQENMNQLAKQAKLPGNAWNRDHATMAADLCSGNTLDVDKMVDNGSVKAVEAEAIAKVLGKVYEAKPRSVLGRAYENAYTKFKAMGACNACADNIAQHYTREPNSPCGTLSKSALDGKPEAIKKLVEFPDFCKWKY